MALSLLQYKRLKRQFSVHRMTGRDGEEVQFGNQLFVNIKFDTKSVTVNVFAAFADEPLP
jgi:hypothetical protein